MSSRIKAGSVEIGGNTPLALIAGPCVIESRKECLKIAGSLAKWAREESVPFIFKASYDKANRSSVKSFRGPGLTKGLEILQEVRDRYGVPVLTDVHNEGEAALVRDSVDIIQIPAFLCRQTDLLLAAGQTMKPVNVKKGQFLSAAEMTNVIEKITSTGNNRILLTERGNCFGYNELVMDMRNIARLSALKYPVVVDATHGVQRPGAAGSRSSGESNMAPVLARAGVAAGCDAVFLECHSAPKRSMSDPDTSLSLTRVKKLYEVLRKIHEVA
jgi:2-dehydro-3-deoxyphosphooctonate aldolase (KDO 8-P synthase)